MAIRNQAAVLWQAWIGKQPPRTVREGVDLVGVDEAARIAGVRPRTIKDWLRREERAIPRTVGQAIQEMGGVDQAAQAAGVKPRTIREWLRGERRGRTPGQRQAAHIGKLTDAAKKQHIERQKPTGNQAKLTNGVISSPKARQQAMSSRRAARMSNSGAHLSMSAKVTVDTGRRKDERWRNISMNFRDDVMSGPTNSFLNGDDAGAIGKLGEAFGEHYAPGTGWQFGEIRGFQIGEFNPGAGGVFPDSGY
ncbi:hypothetical protein [Streptomyces sp. NPDC017940]|uniref:hypothetical protein n=1 Tax=Streptomyces sp. NPDC017940 TaxID=3365017 RepID=UPI0037970A0D